MKIILIGFISLLSISGYSQNKVSGNIIDAVTEKPIKAATIIKVGKNQNKPVFTDKKGKFSMAEVNSTDTLIFSADGYSSATLAVGNATKIKVILFATSKSESVEVGYGNQSTRSLTSSVKVLEVEDFNRVINADIYSYLKGRIPGLQILKTGSNILEQPKVMLRGGGSLSGTYEPLIVIDGVQNASLTNLDPNDVGSVTVLKDASAQAIYGSQANGGVIIIKTKKKKS